MDVYIIIYIIYIYLVGGLEHDWIMTFHSVGNGKSSQLTNSIIFQRGRYTTNQICNDCYFWGFHQRWGIKPDLTNRNLHFIVLFLGDLAINK